MEQQIFHIRSLHGRGGSTKLQTATIVENDLSVAVPFDAVKPGDAVQLIEKSDFDLYEDALNEFYEEVGMSGITSDYAVLPTTEVQIPEPPAQTEEVPTMVVDPGYVDNVPQIVEVQFAEVAETDNWQALIDELRYTPVVVTELVHGELFSAFYSKSGASAGVPDQWGWRASQVWEFFTNRGYIGHEVELVVVRTATDYGVEPAFMLEDILLNGKAINQTLFYDIVGSFHIVHVPVIVYQRRLGDILKERTIEEWAAGVSGVSKNHQRHGIVVRPMVEIPNRDRVKVIIQSGFYKESVVE